MTTAADALLKHGYTLGDLEKLARGSIQGFRRLGQHVGSDAFDVAYGAVAEALYAAEEKPTRVALIVAGQEALKADKRQEMQAHGHRQDSDGTWAAFDKFWWGYRVTPFPDDAICDRIALVQVLPLLTKRQCDALIALASAGSPSKAAEQLGLSRAAMTLRLSGARATFLKWWMEHETPVAHRVGVTCRNGHDRAEFTSAASGRCLKCDAITARRKRRRRIAARVTEVAA